MASGSVINNAGASIIGDFEAIATEGNTTIFNAGTISANSGPAIVFAFFAGNTLTLGPGSVINDNVVATGSDTFQLGGTGSDTFNASNIGTQYTGFTTFNKIGTSTWTLTEHPPSIFAARHRARLCRRAQGAAAGFVRATLDRLGRGLWRQQLD